MRERDDSTDAWREQPHAARNIARSREPRVRSRVVVALDGEARRAVAADDAVHHDVPGADLALGHAVADDVADGVRAGSVEDGQVAGVEAREHRIAADDDIRRR